MNRTHRTILAVLFIGVITVCAILMAEKVFARARADLTERRDYTLSQGTRNILAGLNQTVRLKLYYARVAAMKGPEQIRFYNNYYLYVRSLLEEYVRLSQGKLILSIFDPRPYSDEEEEALNHGLTRIPMLDDESFFFGLVAQTELGKEKAIPFFQHDRQVFVEYDVSRLISDVTRREKKKVGVLSSLPVTGGDMSPYMMQMMQMQGRMPEQPWTIVTHLKDQYEVVPVKKDAEAIQDDVDFLMVVQPKDLSRKTLFAVDQFVMRGGALLVFVDPHCYFEAAQQSAMNPYGGPGQEASSDLNSLLANWGVEAEPGAIAADRVLAAKASMSRNQPPTTILTFLALDSSRDESSFNRNETITSELHSIQMLFAGVLKEVAAAGTTVTPLLSTTKIGNTWTPSDPFELMALNPSAIRRAVSDGTEPLMLACRITGKLKSNFPEGLGAEEEEKPSASQPAASEPAEASGASAEQASASQPADDSETATASAPAGEEPPKPKVLRESTGNATVVVVADVDMITDMLAYQQSIFGPAVTGDNAALVFNALDFLSGAEDLIAIRSRGRFNRPFVVVDDIEENAAKATAAQVEAVNAKISDYEKKLRDLTQGSDDEEVDLVAGEVLAERQNLQGEIRKLQKQLRMIQAGRREGIEALGQRLQTWNTVFAPVIVLVIAVVLAAVRRTKTKYYAARRTQE